MLITNYTKRLQQLKPEIDWQEFKRKVRTQRKWNSKHFENRYVEKILKLIINNYEMQNM